MPHLSILIICCTFPPSLNSILWLPGVNDHQQKWNEIKCLEQMTHSHKRLIICLTIHFNKLNRSCFGAISGANSFLNQNSWFKCNSGYCGQPRSSYQGQTFIFMRTIFITFLVGRYLLFDLDKLLVKKKKLLRTFWQCYFLWNMDWNTSLSLHHSHLLHVKDESRHYGIIHLFVESNFRALKSDKCMRIQYVLGVHRSFKGFDLRGEPFGVSRFIRHQTFGHFLCLISLSSITIFFQF